MGPVLEYQRGLSNIVAFKDLAWHLDRQVEVWNCQRNLLLGDAVRFGEEMTDDVVMVTQEHAYSSPIWHTPKQ